MTEPIMQPIVKGLWGRLTPEQRKTILSDKESESACLAAMIPGQRIYFKMRRITRVCLPDWENLADSVKAAYNGVAAKHPDMVPTIEEIIEREAAMTQLAEANFLQRKLGIPAVNHD